jgi:sugar (pentulose or hexulose) kinase
VTLREQEAAAYGGALQSIWCWHLEKGEKVGIRDITESRVALDKAAAAPDPSRSTFYEELQDRFNSLWKRLVPEFKAQQKLSGRI